MIKKINEIGNISVGKFSRNLGDEIIEESCNKFLSSYNLYKNIISSHQRIDLFKFSEFKKIKYWIVGGSNILGNRKFRPGQLPFGFLSSIIFKPKLLMLGVGWIDNSKYVDLYSKFKTLILYPVDAPHSVRDSNTKNLLNSIGFENVFNTSCPSLWNFSKDINNKINKNKSKKCVFTLTDYRKSYLDDLFLIKAIDNSYEDIYFWPQGSNDYDYLRDLAKIYKLNDFLERIRILPRTLNAFDQILKLDSIDYLGTRLHAGIRALQNNKRSLIIAVDNRAKGISRDNNLWIIDRFNIQNKLEDSIQSSYDFNIKIDFNVINSYRDALLEYLK